MDPAEPTERAEPSQTGALSDDPEPAETADATSGGLAGNTSYLLLFDD